MKKFIYLSTMMLLLAGCEDSAPEAYSDYIAAVAIESLALSVDGATEGDGYGTQLSKVVSIEESFDLKAVVLPADASSQWYTWEVEDEDDILTFDAKYGGKLTANKVGTAKITARAKADETIAASLDLMIHNYVVASDLKMSTPTNSYVVVKDDVLEFDLAVNPQKSYESIVWSLSNANAAIYGSTSKESVKIVGASAGDVTLVATFGRGDALEPLVIEYPLVVVESYVAVTGINATLNGKALGDDEPISMWVDDVFTLNVATMPENAVIKSFDWVVNDPSSNVDCQIDGSKCTITGVKMGTTASITVTSKCTAGGEYITRTIPIVVKALPTVGFYYYADYTYSEDLDPNKEVLGFIYSIDEEIKRAYVVSVKTPYSGNGANIVNWITSTSEYATSQFVANYEFNGIFDWYTKNGVGDGLYNMMVAQFAEFKDTPAFKAVDDLNDNSINYYEAYMENRDNVWYLPTGSSMTAICSWIYNTCGSEVAANEMFNNAGRPADSKQFSVFTGSNTRFWSSYDDNGAGGEKINIYYVFKNTTGAAKTLQKKTGNAYTAPVLHFSYRDM